MKKRFRVVPLLLSCLLLLTPALGGEIQETDWMDADGTSISFSTGSRGRVKAPAVGNAASTSNETWSVDGDCVRILSQSADACEFEAVSAGMAWLTFECDYIDSASGEKAHYTDETWIRVTAPLRTVTLDPNGGTVSPSSRRVTEGYIYGELPVPARDGYLFDGWYTAPDGGECIELMDVVTGDVTLYAHWRVPPKIDSVTVDGAGVTVTLSGDVPAGASVYVAAYAADGQFLRFAATKDAATENAVALSTDGAENVTAFLFDGGMRPLCEPASPES